RVSDSSCVSRVQFCRVDRRLPGRTVVCSTSPAPSPPYPLSLHDALPISCGDTEIFNAMAWLCVRHIIIQRIPLVGNDHIFHQVSDRKSTRLNSSHVSISYAVFCLQKKIHAKGTQKAVTLDRQMTAVKDNT